MGCARLTSITIPNSVTSIGSWAFPDCLTAVYINDLIAWCNISFEDNPFSSPFQIYLNGKEIKDLVIPENVTSISNYAFAGCTSLTSITIPESVTSIGRGAFSSTPWYDNQPDGLIYAGRFAYAYKGTMPSGTSITIKDGTLGIANGAFSYCTRLTSISIPESLVYIGEYAFENCGLKTVIIPESVTKIGYGAFMECGSLYSVTIGNSVMSSGASAVARLGTPTSVTAYINKTSIGDYAFQDCSRLAFLHIGNNVTSIGYGAFEGTSWYDKQPDGLIYAGRVAYTYKGTMLSGTSITIDDGTLGIADHAFSGCTGLASITIPESLTNIGENAFYGCNGIQEIYCFAEDTPKVSPSAFSNVNVSDVILVVPNNVEDNYRAHEIWG